MLIQILPNYTFRRLYHCAVHTTTHLKKSDIIINWSIYSLIGVAALALVLKYFSNYTNLDLSATILAFLGVIAFSIARHSMQVNSLDEKLIQTKKSVEIAETYLKTLSESSRNAIILNPADLSDYLEAWKGFTGIYRAFNPSFIVIEQVGRKEVIESVFAERFKDKNFETGLYLFYRSENSLQQLEKFRKLMKEVKKVVGEQIMSKKLQIGIIEGEGPMYEFYSGEKGKIKTAIVDFWASPPEKKYQISNYVLLMHAEKIIVSLNAAFVDKWEDPKTTKISIDTFLNTTDPV